MFKNRKSLVFAFVAAVVVSALLSMRIKSVEARAEAMKTKPAIILGALALSALLGLRPKSPLLRQVLLGMFTVGLVVYLRDRAREKDANEAQLDGAAVRALPARTNDDHPGYAEYEADPAYALGGY